MHSTAASLLLECTAHQHQRVPNRPGNGCGCETLHILLGKSTACDSTLRVQHDSGSSVHVRSVCSAPLARMELIPLRMLSGESSQQTW